MADPHFANVALLLHCDGADGSTTITDSSASGKTVSTNGGASLSTASPLFGSASANIPSGGWLEVPDSSDLLFGGSDFTVELSARFRSNPVSSGGDYGICLIGHTAVASSGRRWMLQISGPNLSNCNVYAAAYNSAGVESKAQATGVNLALNTRHTFAMSRNGNFLRLFINGASVATASVPGFVMGAASRPLMIGRFNDSTYSYFMDGDIDEVRITNGVGRYVDSYTPQSVPFQGADAAGVDSFASAPSTLGSAAAIAALAVSSICSSPTPLAVPAATAQAATVASMAAGSPLGAILAKSAVQVSCSAPAASPLGSPAALSASASSRASVESPLTPAIVRAVMGGRALASVPSMLSSASALVNHDFTVALGDVTTRYLLDLVTPGGLVRAPISSWQGTLQTGAKCYMQAVIPASTLYADAINAATEFVISRAAALPSGLQIEQEMARSPVGSAQFDRGAMRETCTISGYADGFTESTNPPAEYDRTLSRIRSMSSGAGGMRVRCAVDWLLRPGQRAFADGVPMIADYINYYAPTGGDSYMDVGERA